MHIEWLPRVLREFPQRQFPWYSKSPRRRLCRQPRVTQLEALEDRSLLSGSDLLGGLLNLPPIANADVFNVVQDTPLNSVIGVLANDSDPNNDPLNAQLLLAPLNGVLTLNPDGSFLYTPNLGFTGIDVFSYLANDGLLGSLLPGIVTLNVLPEVNLPPIANADVFSLVEDTPLNSLVSVLSNDSDPNGDLLNAQLLTGPLNGLLTLNPDGSFLYTPDLGFTGVDVFSYLANDGLLGSLVPGLVTLNVLPGTNLPPVANDDTFHVNENSVLNLSLGTFLDGVLANDVDPELVPLTATLVTPPQHGSLLFLPTGTFIYTPDTNYTGTDSFTYQASDLFNLSNIATATFIIDAVNQPPVANSDSFTVPANGTLNSTVSVLANDSDPDGDSLTAQLVTPPVFGTLVLNVDGTFQYTPDIGFLGVDVFTYLANDGTTNSLLPATVTLTTSALSNQPPVANDDLFHVDENSVLNLSLGTILDGVLANDTDAELVPLTASLVTTTQNGSLVFLPTGTFIYTPDPNFTGVDSFTYQASDLLSLSNVATAIIIVDAVNSAPVANPDSFNVPANGTFNSGVSVLANDTDANGDPLTAQLLIGPLNGNLTLNPNGTFQYTPTLGFIGIDVFTYQANDGALNSLPTTVTLSTAAIGNQPPVAVNDTFHVNEDSILNLSAGTIANGVLANDTDPELAPLLAFLVTPPQNGTLTFLPTGTFIYTPDPNFSGADSFTYQASDGQSLSNIATATIIVDPLNDPPIAANDSYSTTVDVTLNVSAAAGVLANDIDPDSGQTLTAAVVTIPTHGTVTLSSNGSFVYTPTAGFTGTDSFTYRASDGLALSNVATVTIAILPIGNPNTAPIAVNDVYNLGEDTTLNTSIANGVLFNDIDADGDPLTAILVSGPTNGMLTLNANGTFTYTSNSNFTGLDSFTYQANDGSANSNVGIVQLNVSAANDAPIGNPDAYVTNEGETLIIAGNGVLGNDVDPDGNPLTASLVTNPTQGTLILNSNGSFTYTPTAGFSGTDSFIYQANDATSNSGPVTVTITVNSTNTAPVSVNDAYTVNEDAVLMVPAIGVLANDTDADDDTLTAVLVSQPLHGTLVLNADGSLTYTPVADFNGSDSFTYRANDGAVNGNVATVNITVTPQNEAPIIITSPGSQSSRKHKRVVLDPAINLIDADSPNFGGGNLDVAIQSGGGSKDFLGYRKGGAKKGLVNAKRGQLRIGRTVIGSITGGKRGSPVHVEYNSNATQARVELAMQNLIFRGTGKQPGPRVVAWQITDETNLDSNVATKSVDVT